MELIHQKNGEVNVIVISGKFDSGILPEFESMMLPLINCGAMKVVVDCSKMDYINDVGLRVLLLAGKKIKTAGGKFVLSSLRTHIRDIFEIAGFTSIFSIYSTPDEAVNSI